MLITDKEIFEMRKAKTNIKFAKLPEAPKKEKKEGVLAGVISAIQNATRAILEYTGTRAGMDKFKIELDEKKSYKILKELNEIQMAILKDKPRITEWEFEISRDSNGRATTIKATAKNRD